METKEIKLEPALYVTSTPIGNKKDITLRAIEILKSVDIIACEDTRVTAKLLEMIGIGYKLVKECRELGIKVVAIPGVSSTVTALSISGLATDKFMFCGFLQPKSNARVKQLEEIKSIKATIIFFEVARRLIDSLGDIKKTLGNREVCVARELTKIYEEANTDSIDNIIKHYTEKPPKGEIVLLIEGWNSDIVIDNDGQNEEIMSFIEKEIDNLKPKKIAKELNSKFNIHPKDAYQMILDFKNKLK